MPPEDPWEVHHDGKVRRWPEAKVVRKLASGDLSGVELARRSPTDDWRPLHATPLFRDAVPHTGDSMSAARARAISSFLTHLVAFILVNLGIWAVSGVPPFGALFWGIGVFAHGAKTLEAVRSTSRIRTSAPPQRAPSEVEAAVDRLVDSGWTKDVDALRSVAAELARRRALLDEAADPATAEALRAELAEVDAALADAPDPATADVLTTTRDAIAARLAFLEDTSALAARTRARERALLHHVESLRLGLLRQGESDVPDLGDAVARLRDELQAEAEVTDALARARARKTAGP